MRGVQYWAGESKQAAVRWRRKRSILNAPHPLAPSPQGRGGSGRIAPAALWAVAESFLHLLYNLFGPPERIAFQHTLTKAPYPLLLSWLRAGEALMRRLLIIEAAALPKPNTPPRLWPTRTRARKVVGFDDDKPEAWRVSLRCFSSPVFGGSGSRRSRETMGELGGNVAAASAAPTDRCAITSPKTGEENSTPPGRSRKATKPCCACSPTPRPTRADSRRACTRCRIGSAKSCICRNVGASERVATPPTSPISSGAKASTPANRLKQTAAFPKIASVRRSPASPLARRPSPHCPG